MVKLSRSRSLLLLAVLILIWGINWPLSKYALAYTPPVLFSGLRTLLGGLVLLFVALPRLKQLRFRETWSIYFISAVVNVTLYYGLQTIGLRYLPSGLFSVIVFLQPVFVGIFSWLWLGEPMFLRKIIGFILGFAGVAAVSAGGVSGHISIAGILLGIGSALSWGLGTIYVKKIGGRVDSIWLVTLQCVIGGILLMAGGLATEKWSDIHWNTPFTLDLLFISIFVIAIGWLIYYKLVNAGEASKVASYTFLIPLVAIVCGIVFLHEPFTMYLLLGLILIVTSILLVNRKPPAHAARKPASYQPEA
ncbi:EamA family transporter [Paenibacillus sp. CAA11]|uniref:DMT family transporter n=1 Tax=Paenibacillus sp. CAA11 TaxID=1532905 RepID=UPI000D33A92E|nr:DMT family transporter [Paenibacillus sp. CAA11]AWB43066.1 EamA family transporter [Paenibacillus sp. CAA11]